MGKEYSEHMSQRLVTAIVLLVFIVVGLFGLRSLLSHSDHHSNCPLQGATTVLCESTTIEHIGIWQAMFVAVLIVLVVSVGVHLFFKRLDVPSSTERVRLRNTDFYNPRPTLLQELFSDGILNRKESYAFC
jgi:uncharacterized membrane protein